jgi:hypothetical protein
MSGGEPEGFETGLDIARKKAMTPDRTFRYGDADPAVTAALVVRPEVDIAAAKSLWNAYLEFRDTILKDPACYDVIEGGKEMNRTGATRLAVPFGLSIEDRGVDEGRVQDAESGDFDYRYRAHVRVSKGARFVDAVGSCRLSEIAAKTKDKGTPGTPDFKPGKDVPIGQREHFAMTKAWTRASKRGIADMLGGTEAD